VQEYFWCQLCQLADSESDRKAMTLLKSSLLVLSMAAESDYTTVEHEHQWSINDFWSCVLGNQTTDRLQNVIKEFLASFIAKTGYGTLSAPSGK
jgi:hypothetical protein